MNIIFPSSMENVNEVDTVYKEEYVAASSIKNLNVFLFDYSEWFFNKKIQLNKGTSEAKEYVSRYAMVCDGETWNLKFTFIKGKRCKELNFYGDNCFPHNFDEFESLFLHSK